MIRKKLISLLLVILIVSIGLYCYSEDNVLANIRLFTRVLSEVENKYVEEVDKAKLVAAATEGLLRPLDPFCQILVADEDGNMPKGSQGVYEKYGMALSEEDGLPLIGAIIYNSPADKKGLKSGDIIFRINNKVTRNQSLSEVLHKLGVGKADTLKLSIIPVGERGTINYEFGKEEKFVEQSIPYAFLTTDNYAYICINRLNNAVSTELKDKISMWSDAKALILDLRNCPNGSLEEALAISDIFLPEGKIITKVGTRNSKENTVLLSKTPALFSDKPLIILTGKGTFGFAEIIAASLKEYGVAVVIGERTAGKTGIQEVLPISPKYAIELTTKEYLTPDGSSLLVEYKEKEDGKKEVVREPGLEPDLTVEEKNLSRFARNLSAKGKIKAFDAYNPNDSEDDVLQKFKDMLDEEDFEYDEDTLDKNKDDIFFLIRQETYKNKGKSVDLRKFELEENPIYNKALELLAKADTNEDILKLIQEENKSSEEEKDEK